MGATISVVIDNHNYGRYLGEAVRSVLRQRCPGEVECIVSDDGSTDESREVIASFGGKVRSLLRSNEGQASAFNAGFSAARGEFVCLLDSDDYWHPDKIAQCLAFFDDPEVGVVQHFLQDVDGEGRALAQRFPAWPARYATEDFLDGRLQLTATSGLMFRRSVLDRVLPVPRRIFYYLDDMLFVKALLLSKGANVPKVLGYHRVHGKNFCAGGYWSPEKLELDLEMKRLFNDEIDPLLRQRGLRRSARYEELEDLEYFRRRILLRMLRGERRRASLEWWAMVKKHGVRRFGLFRIATCLIALLSPALYLRLYESYRGSDWGFDLRRRLFSR